MVYKYFSILIFGLIMATSGCASAPGVEIAGTKLLNHQAVWDHTRGTPAGKTDCHEIHTGSEGSTDFNLQIANELLNMAGRYDDTPPAGSPNCLEKAGFAYRQCTVTLTADFSKASQNTAQALNDMYGQDSVPDRLIAVVNFHVSREGADQSRTVREMCIDAKKEMIQTLESALYFPEDSPDIQATMNYVQNR